MDIQPPKRKETRGRRREARNAFGEFYSLNCVARRAGQEGVG